MDHQHYHMPAAWLAATKLVPDNQGLNPKGPDDDTTLRLVDIKLYPAGIMSCVHAALQQMTNQRGCTTNCMSPLMQGKALHS